MSGVSKRQGGWIATFLVIALVLTLGLAGTIYFLKRGNSVNVATQGTDGIAQHDSNESKKDTEDDATDTSKATTNKDNKDDSASVDTDASTSTKKAEGTNDAKSKTDEHHSAAALPQTGPSDTVRAVIVVSLITFAAVSYAQSRQFRRFDF